MSKIQNQKMKVGDQVKMSSGFAKGKVTLVEVLRGQVRVTVDWSNGTRANYSSKCFGNYSGIWYISL